MPKVGRPMTMIRDQRHVKKMITTLLVIVGLGGATVLSQPTPRPAAVAVEQPAPGDAEQPSAGDVAARTAAPATNPPVVVTSDSSAQDIVKAIVSQGQAAGLSGDQIDTVIATAKIESSFRPTVSGGVQAYGGPGTGADEVIGLFQEKAGFGTVAERRDPNKAIARFITRFIEAHKKNGTGDNVQAATLAQNPQLLKHNRGVGTHYYNTVKAALGAAADLHRQALGITPQPVT